MIKAEADRLQRRIPCGQIRSTQQPVTQNEQGAAPVSGCTPRVFSMVTAGRLSPMDYMPDILHGTRYAPIAA